jgi:transposase-like protein
MESKQRRQFSAEEKVAAVRRHLVGKESVSTICEELQVQPSVFYEWQKCLFERGASAFNGPGKPRASSRERELEEKLAKLEAKLTRKDSVIAEISAEYVQLKKELGEP